MLRVVVEAAVLPNSAATTGPQRYALMMPVTDLKAPRWTRRAFASTLGAAAAAAMLPAAAHADAPAAVLDLADAAAPWFGGNLDPATRYAWDMTAPASTPLYLLAFADDSGQIDPGKTTITVN